MSDEASLLALSRQLGCLLRSKGQRLVTAESCTGGMLGQYLTAVSGSSQWYDGGVISYSNAYKQTLLGVSESVLIQYGAVSTQTVKAMLQGALSLGEARCAIAVTGVAGPSGGSESKPVGTVLMAWGVDGRVSSEAFLFKGARDGIRQQTTIAAFEGMIRRLNQ